MKIYPYFMGKKANKKNPYHNRNVKFQAFKIIINQINVRQAIVKFIKLVSYLKSAAYKSRTLRLHNYLTQPLKTLKQEKGVAYTCNIYSYHFYIPISVSNEHLHMFCFLFWKIL